MPGPALSVNSPFSIWGAPMQYSIDLKTPLNIAFRVGEGLYRARG